MAVQVAHCKTQEHTLQTEEKQRHQRWPQGFRPELLGEDVWRFATS